MTTISSRSKQRVRRLFTPPTDKTGVDVCAPTGLTVRQLIHHRRREKLRRSATMILVESGHVLSIENLAKFGYDLCG